MNETKPKKTSSTTHKRVEKLVQMMRGNGVSSFKVGDVEVVFDHQSERLSEINTSAEETTAERVTRLKREVEAVTAEAIENENWSV